jgi:hypothetical protein
MLAMALWGSGENMKRLLWITTLIPFIAIISQRSKAVEVTVGEVQINLAAPKGYCPLDKQNPAESQVLDAMQQVNQGRTEELGAFAQCDRLKAWREGKADDLGNTADYQISLSLKGRRLSAEREIPGMCATFRMQGAAIVKDMKEEINKRFDSVELFAKSVKINTQKMYGVLHEDKNGCYVGFVQKLVINDQMETVFIVSAITVVKGKLIFFYHGSNLDDPSAIQRLLATSRSTVEATLAQN